MPFDHQVSVLVGCVAIQITAVHLHLFTFHFVRIVQNGQLPVFSQNKFILTLIIVSLVLHGTEL